MENVKFVSYDGKYPNLCRGRLTLEIKGEKYTFSDESDIADDYDAFWRSGGKCHIDKDWNDWTEKAEWIIEDRWVPEEFEEYAEEMKKVFNENVPFGCCGGCI